MRLTLRTLLAYLDDILDPVDKDELSQKIESSEFAEDLMHRTRDTMRRLRLSAPQPIGTGMALDPNTVAEYLDNVLPPDQVGDYERICLESDVHLAEAAACHHVLTMVLGEPANVEPRARQRMYNIPAEARDRRRMRVEPAHVKGAATVATVAAAAKPHAGEVAGRPAKFEIPEYLRTRSWWQSRGALAALGLLLLVGAALYGLSGVLGWSKERPAEVALDDRNDNSRSAAPAETQPEPTDETAMEPASEPSTPAPAAQVGERYTDPAATADALAAPPQLLTPDESAPPVNPLRPSTNPKTTGPVVESTPRAAAVPPPVEAPATGETASAAPTTNVVPPSESAPLPIPPQNETVGATRVESTPVAPEDTRVAAATPAAAPPGEVADVAIDVDAGEEAPAGPAELGTYLSGKTVLLRYDDASGAWFRVEPRSAVVAGQHLLSLPEFRPKITLASGVHLDMAGGTMVRMLSGADVAAAGLPAVGGEMPVIEILYGKVILINTSNAENQVRLKLGPHVGDARIDRNATLAIEVERPYVPGNDPRKTASPVVVRMFAPDGGIQWQDAAGAIVADKASRWTLAAGAPAVAVDDPAPPEWIDQEPAAHLSEQRFGAPVIESRMVSNQPADIQLLELFKGSERKEVKSLVTRSSIHVGLFAPFVEALRDSDQKWPTWRTHIETLRTAMAFSPESAERVSQALVEQRGRTAGDDLYEMLCGYNAEQIGQTPDESKVGALKRLVDWLEEDSLDYRVLSVYNLWEITGKQLMPNPAASVTVRKQNVRRWRDRLEAGELLPVERQ